MSHLCSCNSNTKEHVVDTPRKQGSNERKRRSRRTSTSAIMRTTHQQVLPHTLACSLLLIVVLLCLSSLQGATANNQQTKTNEEEEDSSSSSSSSHNFPTLTDTFEMASLSRFIYKFRKELNDNNVCQRINSHNYTEKQQEASETTAVDLNCHWYRHDKSQGTQVMIVSSAMCNYIAIVFAGTDDLRTSLTDADLLLKPFGNGGNVTLPGENGDRVKIHAGFDNAVFEQDLFWIIQQKLTKIRMYRPQARLFTTGHSLGAADSVLTAVALTLYYQQQQQQAAAEVQVRGGHSKKKKLGHIPIVTSLNFGCPQIGNSYWHDYFNQSQQQALLGREHSSVGIWRFVLGWDLVPRLPEFMQHGGHTVQLYRNSIDPENATASAYYQHYGDAALGLAGVPFGWSSKPFIWVPGSLSSHMVSRYWEFFRQWRFDSSEEHQASWLQEFVAVDNVDPDDDDDDRPLPNVDDDFWVDPPDDDATTAAGVVSSVLQEVQGE